jgi:DNA invertase Pin-like site-specific DNA recombinase
MKIGYARVSTEDQNLDLQMDALNKAGCEKISTDHGVSGISVNRVGLSQAIAAVGAGDVLVVWKLDRLGRSLSFFIELIEKLRNDQADLKVSWMYQYHDRRRKTGFSYPGRTGRVRARTDFRAVKGGNASCKKTREAFRPSR